MTTEHNIVKQETELRELLNRVMDAPLQPLKKSVEDISKHFDILEKIEDQIKELRENDLIPLQKLEALEKLGKKIKSLIEDDFSEEVKTRFTSLEKSQQSIYEQILQLQKENAALTIQFENKLSQSFLSMKRWIIIAASLAGIGVIEVGVTISRHLL